MPNYVFGNQQQCIETIKYGRRSSLSWYWPFITYLNHECFKNCLEAKRFIYCDTYKRIYSDDSLNVCIYVWTYCLILIKPTILDLCNTRLDLYNTRLFKKRSVSEQCAIRTDLKNFDFSKYFIEL